MRGAAALLRTAGRSAGRGVEPRPSLPTPNPSLAGRGIALLVLFCASSVQAQQLASGQAALEAHVRFLASDALKGREAGTHDYDIAAEYVAAQMIAAGLKPGAGDSWLQPVGLATYKPAEKARWTLTRGGTAIPLQFGIDFVNQGVATAPTFTAEAPVVFAGYGLVYPQGKRDDYRGLDVRGKIVAIYAGVPAGLPGDVAAHLGDDDQKARLAQARGARAVIIVESLERRSEFPIEALAPYYDYERTTWIGPDGSAHILSPGAPVVGLIGQAGAEKLFAGSRIRWRDVLGAELRGTRMPTGPLVGTLKVTTKTSVRTTRSSNVVGMLEGADPALRNEVVVLSAHLDHIGVGEPEKGDAIYNGAMDNAIGIAAMLEVARSFQASGTRPRRSILFLALTAEEKGLIGSSYFAAYPALPTGSSLVADINLDMPILTYALQDLVVLGGERSSLGAAYAAAAAAEGLKVVPDPAPEENFFVRSDHYSFVQAGIPAVSVDSGPGGPGEAAQREFLAGHYHKPSDDLSLPIDWAAAAKFTRLNYAAARAIADADARPQWNKGDFFGVAFGGHGAK
ncbi:M20/M25/M40 family metallo-hydrolase [Sphingomonas psychrotolerans]|uniref:M20/M25/M40 family metallo-hydrolase n=1 Tax=Sphingomonas psychrotolerans TaxID=1327635 RepID=A0ABU3NAB3_9SPHN|nr:M20/M25/M40 family metallo-hydrolase [Sphingomonas psychrotolerans]MDT8760441.1 M20/M25/M40 family metallo-hydrolase [Sphingomonas psychrotolerans]